MKKYILLSTIFLIFTIHSQEPIQESTNKSPIALENRLTIDVEPMILHLKKGKIVLARPHKKAKRSHVVKALLIYLWNQESEIFKKLLPTKDL